MSRHYFAVFNRLFRTPKFHRLSESAKLSLFHVWAIAGDQNPEPTWTCADELAEFLAMYERPTADVGSLLDAGFLEELEDGRIGVYAWDEHQVAADVASSRSFEASRKREWRRKKRETEKREQSRTRPGRVRDRVDGSMNRQETGAAPPPSRKANEDGPSHVREHLPPIEEIYALGDRILAAEAMNGSEGAAVTVSARMAEMISEGDR